MARWPNRRRQRRSRLLRLVPLLALVGVAVWWLLTQPLPVSISFVPPAAVESLTPDLYGVPSRAIPLGGDATARLVDRADSGAPMVLIVTDAGEGAEPWAGVQALLERQRLASLVVSGREAPEAIRRAMTVAADLARGRSQPLGVVAAGSAVDRIAELAADSPVADRPLAVLSPLPPPRRGTDALRGRLPDWIERRLGPSDDQRLGAWRGPVLIVRASDDHALDAVGIGALRDGTRRARVLAIDGPGYRRAPAHPEDDAWIEIAGFLRGVTERAPEVVLPVPDSLADSTRQP